jgi:UV DNA damage repair endonuclease
MYVCMNVCNACIYAMYVPACVYTYVCMYVHEHSRARTHTHTRYESVDQYRHSPKLRYKLHRDKL